MDTQPIPQGDDKDRRSEQPDIPYQTVPIRLHQSVDRSDAVRNDSQTVPNEEVVRSERVPNGSQQSGSEQGFRSEQFRTVPNEMPEPFRTAPICSEQDSAHTITVREAARIFEEAGVPRTERAITKWCNRNARGITRLTCCYNEAERKYFITPESIERVIEEERQRLSHGELHQNGSFFSEAAEDLSEQVRNGEENRSEREPIRSERFGTKGA